MLEMTFLRRLTSWLVIKLLDLIHQERGKDVFLLVGGALGSECPHCGYATYYKINNKKDWGKSSWLERFLGYRHEDACLNDLCNLFGRPWVTQRIPHHRPTVRIPNPDRDITYRPSDPDVRLVTPNGDIILTSIPRVNVVADLKRRRREFRFFN